jgi:hypothetical protein
MPGGAGSISELLKGALLAAELRLALPPLTSQLIQLLPLRFGHSCTKGTAAVETGTQIRKWFQLMLVRSLNIPVRQVWR